MRKLSSVEEFSDFRRRVLSETKFHTEQPTLVVSNGSCGQASGSQDIIRIIKRYIIERSMGEKVKLRITGCHGFCEMEPYVLVEPGYQLYPKLSMKDVPRVIEAAVGGFMHFLTKIIAMPFSSPGYGDLIDISILTT